LKNELDLDNLAFKLRKKSVFELRELVLDEVAINTLLKDSPLHLVSATIQSVVAKVPWTNIVHESCDVRVEKLDVVLCSSLHSVNDIIDELSGVVGEGATNDKEQSKEETESHSEDLKSMATLVDKILANIHVEVKEICVRVISHPLSKEGPTLMLRIDNAVVSKEDSSSVNFIQHDKIVRISGISSFILPTSTLDPKEYDEDNEQQFPFQYPPPSHPSCVARLGPDDPLILKLKFDKNKRINAKLYLTALNIFLNPLQIFIINEFINSMTTNFEAYKANLEACEKLPDQVKANLCKSSHRDLSKSTMLRGITGHHKDRLLSHMYEDYLDCDDAKAPPNDDDEPDEMEREALNRLLTESHNELGQDMLEMVSDDNRQGGQSGGDSTKPAPASSTAGSPNRLELEFHLFNFCMILLQETPKRGEEFKRYWPFESTLPKLTETGLSSAPNPFTPNPHFFLEVLNINGKFSNQSSNDCNVKLTIKDLTLVDHHLELIKVVRKYRRSPNQSMNRDMLDKTTSSVNSEMFVSANEYMPSEFLRERKYDILAKFRDIDRSSQVFSSSLLVFFDPKGGSGESRLSENERDSRLSSEDQFKHEAYWSKRSGRLATLTNQLGTPHARVPDDFWNYNDISSTCQNVIDFNFDKRLVLSQETGDKSATNGGGEQPRSNSPARLQSYFKTTASLMTQGVFIDANIDVIERFISCLVPVEAVADAKEFYDDLNNLNPDVLAMLSREDSTKKSVFYDCQDTTRSVHQKFTTPLECLDESHQTTIQEATNFNNFGQWRTTKEETRAGKGGQEGVRRPPEIRQVRVCVPFIRCRIKLLNNHHDISGNDEIDPPIRCKRLINTEVSPGTNDPADPFFHTDDVMFDIIGIVVKTSKARHSKISHTSSLHLSGKFDFSFSDVDLYLGIDHDFDYVVHIESLFSKNELRFPEVSIEMRSSESSGESFVQGARGLESQCDIDVALHGEGTSNDNSRSRTQDGLDFMNPELKYSTIRQYRSEDSKYVANKTIYNNETEELVAEGRFIEDSIAGSKMVLGIQLPRVKIRMDCNQFQAFFTYLEKFNLQLSGVLLFQTRLSNQLKDIVNLNDDRPAGSFQGKDPQEAFKQIKDLEDVQSECDSNSSFSDSNSSLEDGPLGSSTFEADPTTSLHESVMNPTHHKPVTSVMHRVKAQNEMSLNLAIYDAKFIILKPKSEGEFAESEQIPEEGLLSSRTVPDRTSTLADSKPIKPNDSIWLDSSISLDDQSVLNDYGGQFSSKTGKTEMTSGSGFKTSSKGIKFAESKQTFGDDREIFLKINIKDIKTFCVKGVEDQKTLMQVILAISDAYVQDPYQISFRQNQFNSGTPSFDEGEEMKRHPNFSLCPQHIKSRRMQLLRYAGMHFDNWNQDELSHLICGIMSSDLRQQDSFGLNPLKSQTIAYRQSGLKQKHTNDDLFRLNMSIRTEPDRNRGVTLASFNQHTVIERRPQEEEDSDDIAEDLEVAIFKDNTMNIRIRGLVLRLNDNLNWVDPLMDFIDLKFLPNNIKTLTRLSLKLEDVAADFQPFHKIFTSDDPAASPQEETPQVYSSLRAVLMIRSFDFSTVKVTEASSEGMNITLYDFTLALLDSDDRSSVKNPPLLIDHKKTLDSHNSLLELLGFTQVLTVDLLEMYMTNVKKTELNRPDPLRKRSATEQTVMSNSTDEGCSDRCVLHLHNCQMLGKGLFALENKSEMKGVGLYSDQFVNINSINVYACKDSLTSLGTLTQYLGQFQEQLKETEFFGRILKPKPQPKMDEAHPETETVFSSAESTQAETSVTEGINLANEIEGDAFKPGAREKHEVSLNSGTNLKKGLSSYQSRDFAEQMTYSCMDQSYNTENRKQLDEENIFSTEPRKSSGGEEDLTGKNVSEALDGDWTVLDIVTEDNNPLNPNAGQKSRFMAQIDPARAGSANWLPPNNKCPHLIHNHVALPELTQITTDTDFHKLKKHHPRPQAKLTFIVNAINLKLFGGRDWDFIKTKTRQTSLFHDSDEEEEEEDGDGTNNAAERPQIISSYVNKLMRENKKKRQDREDPRGRKRRHHRCNDKIIELRLENIGVTFNKFSEQELFSWRISQTVEKFMIYDNLQKSSINKLLCNLNPEAGDQMFSLEIEGVRPAPGDDIELRIKIKMASVKINIDQYAKEFLFEFLDLEKHLRAESSEFSNVYISKGPVSYQNRAKLKTEALLRTQSSDQAERRDFGSEVTGEYHSTEGGIRATLDVEGRNSQSYGQNDEDLAGVHTGDHFAPHHPSVGQGQQGGTAGGDRKGSGGAIHQSELEEFYQELDDFESDFERIEMKRKIDPIFVQHFECSEFTISIDYDSHNIDFSKLKSGDLVEFLNMVSIKELNLSMREIHLNGIDGLDLLIKKMVQHWVEDIKHRQKFNFVYGIGSIRSIVNIGSGIVDLFKLPIQQYRRDGRLSRGISLGIKSFITNFTMESINLTETLVMGANSLARVTGITERIPNSSIESRVQELKYKIDPKTRRKHADKYKK